MICNNLQEVLNTMTES